MKRSLEEILDLYYEQELNVSIHSFWDAGWTVKIGDNMNGYELERNYQTLDTIKECLESYLINLHAINHQVSHKD